MEIKLKINAEKKNVEPKLLFDKNKVTIDDEKYSGSISFEKKNSIVCGYMDITCTALPFDDGYHFKGEDTIFIDIPFNKKVTGVLSRDLYNPNWTEPYFEKDFDKLPFNIQNILIESDGEYTNILPLFCDDFTAKITASENKNEIRISISPMYSGTIKISGYFMIMSESDNPYASIEKTYDFAIERNLIDSDIRKNKSYPDTFNYLGWCSWNAFYHDVTDEKLTQKLEEFKSKGIPIGWILIDDGWSEAEQVNWKISSLKEDNNKFPDGLAGFCKKAREEYDVKYIGAWHSALGYWQGIEKESQLFEEQKDNIVKTNADFYFPAKDFKGAYGFFNSWYKYLSSEGIDFVKVDTQGLVLEFLKNTYKPCEKTINVIRAIEQASTENFGCRLMNCMGNANINNLNHKYTNLTRASDDFYPKKDDDFIEHSIENVYSGVFMGYLMWCDYDMFWSNHFDAKRSSILRAISGGPIYMSDAIGESNIEYLKPCIDDDGKILRCDNVGRPTRDCLFNNPKDGVLKVFNTVGDDIVIAAFNLSDKKQTTDINLNDVYTDGKYYMHKYFNKLCSDFEDGMTLELEPNGVEIINLYRMENDNIKIGDTSKYISIATKRK